MMKQESRQRYKNENETSFRKHYFTPLHFIRGIRNAEDEIDEKLLREHAEGIQGHDGTCIYIKQQYNHTADHEDGGAVFKKRKPRKDKNDKQPCGITARRDTDECNNESVEECVTPFEKRCAKRRNNRKHKKHEKEKCRENQKCKHFGFWEKL